MTVNMLPFATLQLDSHLSLILRDQTFHFYEIYKQIEEEDTYSKIYSFSIPDSITSDIFYAQQTDQHQSGEMSLLLTTETTIQIQTPDFLNNVIINPLMVKDLKEITFPQSINAPLILHNQFNDHDIQLLLNVGEDLMVYDCQKGDQNVFTDMIMSESIDLILDTQGESFKFKLATYHNSHIIDVNNDCLNEIVLELQNSSGISIIIILEYNSSLSKFDIIQTNKLGTIKDLHLLDLNADGLIDIFQSEYYSDNDLWYSSILYAQSDNKKSMTTKCNKLIGLNQTQNKTPFRNQLNTLINDKTNNQTNVFNKIYLNYDLTQNTDVSSPYQNSNIQFGDFNADGYVDMMATFKNKVDDTTESFILINEIQPDYSKDFKATFKEQFSNKDYNQAYKQKKYDLEIQHNISNGYLIFQDLNHDGILDILQYSQNNENGSGTINGQINKTIHNPTFITIKMFQMNSNTNLKDDELKYQSQLTNQTGIIRFKYLPDFQASNYYEQQVRSVCANCGLGGRFCAMQLYSGLGNTNGLVIDFTYAVSKFNGVLEKVWSPVIPNSKFLVSNNNEEVWLSLDLNESLVLTRLCVIIGLILVIMLITLYVVHLYEVMGDKKENKKTLKLFKNKRFK